MDNPNPGSPEAVKIFLMLMPDGSVVNWGRHVRVGGVGGYGGAKVYRGEHAEIMRLVLKYIGRNDATHD